LKLETCCASLTFAAQKTNTMSNRTFTMIKPDAMKNGHAGAILEKENAVADFRKVIGATNPAQADEGTIRKLYATSVGENAVHGSDSDENAKIEGSFFFSSLEQF